MGALLERNRFTRETGPPEYTPPTRRYDVAKLVDSRLDRRKIDGLILWLVAATLAVSALGLMVSLVLLASSA